MRILICGGRSYTKRDVVEAVLDTAWEINKRLVVINTGARGAAAFANAWALGKRAKDQHCDVEVIGFRVAMPRVNITEGTIAAAMQMRCFELFARGKPQVVFWFPQRDGELRADQDLLAEAEQRKITVRKVGWETGVRKTPMTPPASEVRP